MLSPQPTSRGNRVVVAVYVATAFVGAAMLFLVQPLVARMLLPSYGGSATVWSTASLFFQCMLLLGYVYTDRATNLLSPRRQRLLHVLVLLIPLTVLPLALPDDAAPAADSSPVVWLLRTLAVMVALPFLVLATTGPLVQRWYSQSGRPRAHDPYFLFAASNLGSFIGLLSYPFAIEPFVTLDVQLRWWSLVFVIFVVLAMACMALVPAASVPQHSRLAPTEPLSVWRQVRWCGWALLPSGLMLSVTSYLSTDVAPIPLLWVVPLAIYLATFVAAFARTTRRPPRVSTRLAVSLTAAGAVSSLASELAPIPLAVPLQLSMLGAVAYAAHSRLAADRPAPGHLTRFYLVIAVGGALGGLLNGVVAPLLFDRVLEHGLLMTCVPLLMLGLGSVPGDSSDRRIRTTRTLALATATVGLTVAAVVTVVSQGSDERRMPAAVLAGLVILLAWAASYFKGVLLLGLASLQVIVLVVDSQGVVARDRTFYGSYLVQDVGEVRELRHGTTTHGNEQLSPSRRGTPTTYYARSGPLGDIFEERKGSDVAVVGLGVGTVADYGEAGDRFTFYEIDQSVADLAAHYFHYLEESRADVEVRIGDGRLGIASRPPASYDLLILDAFSSDAIPTHLLTREAFETYASRLRPGGMIAVHISNRVFDLRPLMRGTMDDLGWDGLVGDKGGLELGSYPSEWVALSQDAAAMEGLASRPGWDRLPGRAVRWTDDYSSVLPLLR